MDVMIIPATIVFVLVCVLMIVALINQTYQYKAAKKMNERVKKSYVIEIDEVGEITMREINPGGGISKQQN